MQKYKIKKCMLFTIFLFISMAFISSFVYFIVFLKASPKQYTSIEIIKLINSDNINERQLGYHACVNKKIEEELLEEIRQSISQNIDRHDIEEIELFSLLFALTRNKDILPKSFPKVILNVVTNKNYDHGIRKLALNVIAMYGPDAREALSALEVIVLDKKDFGERWARYAVEAIGAIGPPVSDATIMALVEGVKAKQMPLDHTCARALAKLGTKGLSALKILTMENDEDISWMAKDAIKRSTN